MLGQALTPGILRSQESLYDRVSYLNTVVQSRDEGGASRASASQRVPHSVLLHNALRERAELLSRLIVENPKAALSSVLPQETIAILRQKYPESGRYLEENGTWEGPTEYVVLDGPDMSEADQVASMRLGDESLDIHFANSPPDALRSGDVLSVRGIRVGSTVASEQATLVATADAAPCCSPKGFQKAVVLLVKFPGVATPTTTPQAVKSLVSSSSGKSFDGYLRETSYGQASISADVFGWYTLDGAYGCEQRNEIRAAAIRVADGDVDFRNYGRVFIVFTGSCNYSGYATIGCSSINTGDGTITASFAWLISKYVNASYGVRLFAHEGGHNLGLNHSSSRDWGNEALGSLNTTGVLDEYGDVFSTMGNWNYGHYTAPQKVQLGWLPDTNVQAVEGTGRFLLQPIELNIIGTQALKVRRGTSSNNWLWIEYRQKLGDYDSTLGTQVFAGVVVHYQDAITGSKTHLLDFTPATSSWSDPALVSGKTWVDPYSNLTISVGAAAPNGIEVTVDYGPIQ